MSPNEFTECKDKTRLKARALAAARSVLVQGFTLGEAATHTGIARSNVSRAVKRFKRAQRELGLAPPADWETIRVTVPASIAAQICSAAEALLRRQEGSGKLPKSS